MSDFYKVSGIKEQILSHGAFDRFYECLELYQKLYSKREEGKGKDILRERMGMVVNLAKNRWSADIQRQNAVDNFYSKVIKSCEDGELEKEKVVDIIICSEALLKLFSENLFNRGKEGESGQVILNNSIRYDLEGGRLNLHLNRNPNSDPGVIMKEITDGCKKVASLIREGKFSGVVDHCEVTSWLLADEYILLFESLVGENLDVVEVNQDDPEYLATVLVALQYNKKPLMKFLKKGDIPFVGRIRMSLIELATRIENTLG